MIAIIMIHDRHVRALVGVLLVAQSLQKMDEHCDAEGTCTAAPSGDPYGILGVAKDASTDEVVKAYRALARRWHPDRNRGKSGVEKTFATIAHAYNMLKNETTREILDRLGEDGLERLRNGDPSVLKGWVPPDEVIPVDMHAVVTMFIKTKTSVSPSHHTTAFIHFGI